MNVLIAGGGTGGHIYPALAIGRALKEKGADVLFVGTRRGLESRIVPEHGFEIAFIDVEGFPRKLSRRLIRAMATALKGVAQARRIVASRRWDACIGTGGYVAGPALLAASFARIPTVIQEQNAYPGLTNRILSRFVTKVALGYEVAGERFPVRDKLVVTGNPIRPEICELGRDEGARRLGIAPGKRTALIFGASQGARSINRAVAESMNAWQAMDAQVLHVTGERGYDAFVKDLEERGYRPRAASAKQGCQVGNVRVFPYMHDMPAALAASDLVVGRAGALSIAETTARGLPAILIPYPHAAENHQEKNARVLAEAGAAKMILDAELTADRLVAAAREILLDEAVRRKMADASRALGRPNAVWDVVALVESVVSSRRP